MVSDTSKERMWTVMAPAVVAEAIQALLLSFQDYLYISPSRLAYSISLRALAFLPNVITLALMVTLRFHVRFVEVSMGATRFPRSVCLW